MTDAAAYAVPRPAATVVVLRDGDPAPEVLMVRRARGASFMADAYVFPGGRLEPADGEGDAAYANGAARELHEEAALAIEPAAMVWFAHWITPSVEPKRFEARFFLAALPAGQTARHDAVETVDSMWAAPAEILARYERGELKLPPPTIRTLEDLRAHASVADALAWGRERRRVLAPVTPKLVPIGTTIANVLPWDPEYASLPGDGAPIAADHPVARPPSRFVLVNGRWWGRTPGT